MDNNTYFCYQMDLALDKADMLDKLRGQVVNAIDHGPVPAAMHTALDFLLFLSSYSNPGHIQLSETYGEVASRLSMAIYFQHTRVANPEVTWPACCATCPERHPDDEIPDDPDEDDGECDEEEELFNTLQELYGPHPNPAHTGTRRPYPDYEHWGDWTAEDWLHFMGYKRKVLAAATCEFATMGLAVETLAAVQANIRTLPMPRQVEVALWASDVADSLTDGITKGLFEICRFNLYTREGRDVQKQLFPVTIGEPNGTPETPQK